MFEISVRNPGVQYPGTRWTTDGSQYFYGTGGWPAHEEFYSYRPSRVSLGEAVKYRFSNVGKAFSNTGKFFAKGIKQLFKTIKP